LSDAEIEAELNPRVAVPDAERYLAEYAARSEAARARLAGTLDVAYGDAPAQTLDVFPAAGEAPPIHVFIHGGYWRALDKSDHSFLAAPLVSAGATVVVLNYSLCPAVTLDDIVGEVRAGLAWIWRHAAEFGGGAARIFVSGHSAGAQLAAMAMAHDWTAEGLPADLIKGVAGVSGVYELAPVMRISVNEEIRLDREMALRNSPTLRPPRPLAPVLVAVGADEPPGFIKQSRDFLAACRVCGVACDYMAVRGEHHFSILYALADATTPLHRAVLAQMGLA
ncbi:MAG: alpha/beta hydrolase, partial [Alphaproteobacteria bacterium]